MKRLVDALVAFMAANLDMQQFIGIGGPYSFFPQPYPAMPFTIITQVGGTPNWQGFGANYVSRPHLRITLWDRDADQVMTNGEFVASVLEVKNSWSLGGSDICRLPIRIEEPRLLEMPPDEDGLQSFGCVLEFRFNVQRTRGVV